MQVSRAAGRHKPLRRTDSPGGGVGKGPSTCQSGHPVRRGTRYIRRRRSALKVKFGLAAALFVVLRCSSPRAAAATAAAAAAAVVAAAAPRPRRRRHQGRRREGHRPQVDGQPAQGHGQVLPGQGHHRRRQGARSRTSTRSTARQGYKATLTEFPASADQQRTPVHPAPAGQVRRLRRLQLRRDLDGGVRQPEVALRPHAVRQRAASRSTSARRSRPCTTAASTGASRETSDAAFIYYRPTRAAARRRRPGSRSTPRPRRRAASSTRARRTRA